VALKCGFFILAVFKKKSKHLVPTPLNGGHRKLAINLSIEFEGQNKWLIFSELHTLVHEKSLTAVSITGFVHPKGDFFPGYSRRFLPTISSIFQDYFDSLTLPCGRGRARRPGFSHSFSKISTSK
jgi:hypothetical protein